jgi:hypothetical protein
MFSDHVVVKRLVDSGVGAEFLSDVFYAGIRL